MKNKIIIATRGSKLALWQANWIKTEIGKDNPAISVELMKIKTTGDKILDVPLAKVGGKGLFVKEIEEALLSNTADLAVHSMKDVPTDLPEGLHLTAICKREDPRDAFVSQVKNNNFQIPDLNSLPDGATVGTSSLRRMCQLLKHRPDLKITQLRGNLDTRIRKLDEGLFDAIIVAVAGMKRLGMADRITEMISTDISLPAIAQGAVGIECRTDDEFINNLLRGLNHLETSICVSAERAFLKKLEGGCQVPIAAHARLVNQRAGIRDLGSESRGQGAGGKEQGHEEKNENLLSIIIEGLVGSESGETIIRNSMEGMTEEAESIGIRLAEDLISKGAGDILAEVYGKNSQ